MASGSDPALSHILIYALTQEEVEMWSKEQD